MNIIQIISYAPDKVASWAVDEFFGPLDNSFESPEALTKLSADMVTLVNQYSFIASVLATLKVECRNQKNLGNKKKYEELVDKRDILQKALDSVKLKQAALSRMITIKQEIDRELNMSQIN